MNNKVFKKGHIPWHKGKKTGLVPKSAFKVGHKMSKKMKLKISKTMKEYRKKVPYIGTTPSEETKAKLSQAMKGKRKGIQNKKLQGKGHWNWQGGKTSEAHKIRTSLEYKLWRESVFQRDNFTCIWCGEHGGKLNADHIKPFAQYPELRFAIDNGRTLCLPCHKTTDSYLKNIKKQK